MNRRTQAQHVRRGLPFLRELLAQGVEFPDVQFQAAQPYHLTDQPDREVVAHYDTTEPDGAAEN